MSQGYVWRSIYDPASWLKLQKKVKSNWVWYFLLVKKVLKWKDVRNSPCFIVLFCGSCRQRKPIQLLNGSNCSNFETTLLRKIPPLTLEGLNWIPSKTHLCLKKSKIYILQFKRKHLQVFSTLLRKLTPLTLKGLPWIPSKLFCPLIIRKENTV